MSDDLADVLGTEETSGLEFKQSAKADAVLQAICAMSNDLPQLGGGDLLIGVDKHGRPIGGVDVSDRALLALTDMRDNGKIIDRPSIVVDRGRYRGEDVVRIRVEASSTPPVRLDGVAWVRPGPTTRRANREDERILTERRRSRQGPFDSQAVFGTSRDDLDIQRFESEVVPAFVSPDVIAENGRPVDLQLASLRVTDPAGTPTVMGLLLVGIDPSSIIPGAYIQFVRYEGVDVDSAIVDAREIRGNVLDSSPVLQSVIRGHLHTSVRALDVFVDRPEPEYPLRALREACMNAVIHRNYESSNAPVRVAWFADRVEVTNPGGPFGQVNETNFARVNDYRNPSLAGAMKALGYVNRFGRGIGTIIAALRDNGNPPPEFVMDDSSWVVIIRRAS